MELRRNGGLWLMGIAVFAVLLGVIGQPSDTTQQARQERLARLHPTPTATPKPRQLQPQRKHGKTMPLLSSYRIQGAGSSAANAVVVDSGIYNGTSYFEPTGGVPPSLWWDGSRWNISEGGPGSTPLYTSSSGMFIDDIPLNDWSPATGDSPAPTLTASGGVPEIASITPNPAYRGDDVIAAGLNLNDVAAVLFSPQSRPGPFFVPADFTVDSDTQITLTVPTGASPGLSVIDFDTADEPPDRFGFSDFTVLPLPATPPPPNVTGIAQTAFTIGYAFPSGWPDTASMQAQYRRVVDADWIDAGASLDLPGTLDEDVTGATVNTPYLARLVSTNAGGTTNGPATAFSTLNSTGGSGGGSGLAPPAPDECRTTDLQDDKVTIIMPALPATAVELWLQQFISGAWVTIKTGLAGGAEWIVQSLTLTTDYDFRAVASNLFGQTPGSACDVRTEALPTPDPDAPAETTVAWLEPAAGAVLSGKVLLRFSVTDTGGNTSGHAVTINNQTVPGVHRVSGNSGDGIYAAVFEARDSANGAATGVISVTGSDSEVATATRAFTVDNGRTAGTKYLPLTQLFDAPDGKRFCALRSLTCDRPALSGNPARRYWMQLALTTNAEPFDAVDWHGTGDEAKAAQAAAWLTLQPVPLSLTNAPRPQIAGQAAIAVRGTMARLCCRLTPREAYSAFQTGMEAVVRIRRYADGDYIVLARNLDGTGAAVWRYNSDGFNRLVDLADYGAEDATDAMLIADDKLHVFRPGEVFILDTESGNVSVNLLPRGEDRTPFRVERLADGRALWLFVTVAHSGDDSKAYVCEAGEVSPVWSWPAALTLSQRVGDGFRFAAGAALLASDGETTPAVVETLDAAITAIDDVTGAASVAPDQARSAWQGAADLVRGAAGRDSADLFTQNAAGDWVLDETLVAPAALDATIDEITALARYTQESETATPLPDRLLIGTAPDGLFLVLERAALSAANGAVEVTNFGGSATAIFGTEAIPA